MLQGAYTLVGRQTHKQIITIEYDLCQKEDVYIVPLNLQINTAQGGIGTQEDFTAEMKCEPIHERWQESGQRGDGRESRGLNTKGRQSVWIVIEMHENSKFGGTISHSPNLPSQER